jgi:thiol:disulfide interchange protein DsbC
MRKKMQSKPVLTPGLVALLVAAIAPGATAEDSAALDNIKATAILSECKARYPNTSFQSLTSTPFPGVFEIQMGKNLAYTDETCRYMIFGHVFDMATQTDLTAQKLPSPSAASNPRLDFDALPKSDAIVTVRGTGKRKIAVFSDPDCPYCKRLEQGIKDMTDITIYTFLFPIEQLHPQAKTKSIAAWCAKDRAEAWKRLMLEGVVPEGNCSHPVDRNIALADALGINGTPAIILEDGTVIPGAIPASQLEVALAQATGRKAAP